MQEIIKKFVAQQALLSINTNGTIERNVLINEFNKFCYDNKVINDLKRDEVIEMVTDEYYYHINKNPKLSKQEWFDSLKPKQFKYNW